jgi:hypothetical protein
MLASRRDKTAGETSALLGAACGFRSLPRIGI